MPSTEKIDIVEKKSQGGANFLALFFFNVFPWPKCFKMWHLLNMKDVTTKDLGFKPFAVVVVAEVKIFVWFLLTMPNLDLKDQLEVLLGTLQPCLYQTNVEGEWETVANPKILIDYGTINVGKKYCSISLRVAMFFPFKIMFVSLFCFCRPFFLIFFSFVISSNKL